MATRDLAEETLYSTWALYHAPLDIEFVAIDDVDDEHLVQHEDYFDGTGTAYKATLGEESVGGIFQGHPDGDEAEIELFELTEAAQGKGLGRLISGAIENAHPDVRVWVARSPTFATRNERFYVEHCGFEIVGMKVNETNADRVAIVLMQRTGFQADLLQPASAGFRQVKRSAGPFAYRRRA